MSRDRGLALAIMRAPYPVRALAVNAYGWRLARKRFAQPFRAMLEDLDASQWLSPDEILERQEERLREIIDHAYKSVPYYRRVMQERSLRPRDIASINDLTKLPLLTKEIINNHFEDLRSAHAELRKPELHRTSGTTGERLRGFLLPHALRWPRNHADLYRAYRWAGFERGDRRATLAGRWFTKRAPFTVVNYAERQLLLSAHHISEGTLPQYARSLESFRPIAVQGHPSAISAIARFLAEQGRSLPFVRCVLTTGEQLYDDQRELIQEAFNCDVFDGWGQGECVGRAYECDQHEGYHVSSEFGVLEIEPSPEGSLGGAGEIIATSLHNDVMPFIRYRTGDLGAWASSPCACGRGLPLLRDLCGRVDDMLEDTAGRPVLPVSIRTRLSAIDGLAQYQLSQVDNGYEIQCVLRKPETPAIDEVVGSLEAMLGQDASIRVSSVEEIAITRGGKERLIADRRTVTKGASR